MKNNLSDLNDHLFSMLERLEDDEAMQDEKELERTLARAKSVCAVSSQILNVANTQIKAVKAAENCGLLNKDMPALIAVKDSAAQRASRQKLIGAAK